MIGESKNSIREFQPIQTIEHLMKIFLLSTMLAAVSLGAQASNLVCNGILMVECPANPYDAYPHGFCGNLSLNNVFVQIKELQPYPCVIGCGSVLIDGHRLISGEYTIIRSSSTGLAIVKPNKDQKYYIRGTIHRVTGNIGLFESDRESFLFSGSCYAAKNLF
jgi:hypothetical protein